MTFDLSEIYIFTILVLLAIGSIIYWRLGVQEERQRREKAAKTGE